MDSNSNIHLSKVKRNVAKMVDMGAPESDIDDYISHEGTTVDDVKKFIPPVVGKPPSDGGNGGSPVDDGALKRFGKGLVEGVGQAGIGIGQAALGVINPKPFFGGEPTSLGKTLGVVTDPANKALTNTVDASRARVNDLGTAGAIGQVAGNVAGSIPFSAAGAAEAAPAATGILSKMGSAALLGAKEGLTQPVGSNDTGISLPIVGDIGPSASNALVGGVTGGLVPAIGDAVVPEISNGAAKLANRAKNLGIDLSVSQIAPSAVRNNLQKVSQEIPFSGVGKFSDAQGGQYYKAAAKLIGQDADAPSPAVIKDFLQRQSTQRDELFKGKTLNVTEDALNSLDKLTDESSRLAGNDISKSVKENVQYIKDHFTDGTISGEKFASLRSQLVKDAASASGPISKYISKAINKLDELGSGILSPTEKQAYGKLQTEYRNYKTMQPLLETANEGKFNPTQLLNRVKSSKYVQAGKSEIGDDDLVDLARIGKEFFPKLGGSDTAPKLGLAIAASKLGAAGTAGLIVGLPKVLGGVVLNRAFQSLYNQSGRVVDAAIRKSLGANAEPAIKLMSKKAPLDVVAKAISNSGAGKEDVKEALEYITRLASNAKDGTPTKNVIKVSPQNLNKKTGITE